jgi:D-alanine-D-alanine ligase
VKVLILYSLPPEKPGPGRQVAEFDMSAGAYGIHEVLPEAELAGVRGEMREVLGVLDSHQPDVVFNLCEAPLGRSDREAHPAALLEWLGIRYTGARSETLALCRRKDHIAGVLAAAGVPVPRPGGFPCIVKPAHEHGSAGLDHASVCDHPQAVAWAKARWERAVLVQEFLPGREFAVALWGAATPEHVSIGETRFQGGLRLNTYAAKWESESEDYADSPLFYPAEIGLGLHELVLAAACGAWRAVDGRGYLRVDTRLDDTGMPRVIDVNANPELSPEVGMHRAVTEAGWTWERFVRQQIEWAT